MTMKKIFLILPAVIGMVFRIAAQNPAEAKTEKPDFVMDKKVYTMKPGEQLVLEPVFTLPGNWTASQWGLYGYFPNVPKAFPKESGLKIENPKSRWGLVRIIPFRRFPGTISNGGKTSLSISTDHWPEGNYSLVFSAIFLDRSPDGKKRTFSIRKNIYIVIEE